jgi:aryl-alcohol dehydrogenase-like predicted oxidoreductase
MERTEIPKRRLGRTNAQVTVLGLGGEGVLRSTGRAADADALINTALDLGINYMESARAYAGSEGYYGAALKGRRDKVFLSSKSHARDKSGALSHLHETLRNMKTDYLDLWQAHDIRTDEDIERLSAPGGAMEAFREARDKGLVRHIGVTGHYDPAVLRRAVELFDPDTVLMPVNPAEKHYKCFLEEVLPATSARDTGVMAMKVFLKGLWDAPKKLLLSYALTMPVSIAVIGCDSVEQIKENAETAMNFLTLKQREVQRTHEIVSPYARSLMYYKP